MPVVVAFVTDVVPLNVVLPAIVKSPVVLTTVPSGATVIFVPVSFTVKPLEKSTIGREPTAAPAC
ncbi:MAG: hypothetical protein E6J23_01290 [Chloroflexi bacterium]|nr:MAG: hypothetical protein E6J23_01290 [Chloroflexota bacterium]